jgi:UDP-glucose 4-epimerase
MNKILIIGSKGFIGSVCYSYFKKYPENDVYGADVVVDYNDSNYFLIDASVFDYRELFKQNHFDWCINCAGASLVPDSFINPLRDYFLNVQLVALLLNAIKEEYTDCGFIQLSSAAVYGNPQTLPIKENHILNPLSPYGIHKKQAEELCKLYFEYFGINTSVLRIFSAYGPGLRKQLFWDLHKKAMIKDEITLFGTGLETREFIYVTDIANAIDRVMKTAKYGHKIINIANNDSRTIADAASVFLRNLSFKGTTKFSGENRSGDPLYWSADISLLTSMGYKPQIHFEQGIKEYAKWAIERG